MNDYKIELGIGLKSQDFNNIKADIKSLEDKPIRLEIDAETKELTQSIQDALKALSKGGQNAFTIDTSKFDESIKDIKTAVLDLRKTFGSLGDNVNMKDLLSSVNQIANAIGKVTDESETLSKSLSALSKKDFGFNFNLKTGNANPLKAATDYGQAASRKAIPAIKEQINYLKDVINVTMDADKALQRYLMKQHKGYAGMQLKNSLEKQVLSGYDLNGEKVSKSDRMVAGEELIGYYKEIAALNNISLDGFNSKFSKSATEIVDDTTKIQTGVKQTEEAVESAVSKMKQMFGGGIGAEQFSTQLQPIVDDLHSIQEAITALSKDTSLGGLTNSFNRLAESIENLLANAEKVKGVLNSGFDTNAIGDDINSIKSPKSTRRRTQSEADEYLNGYLKHWNIKGENAKTVKGKFEAFSQVSSRGVGDELYEVALDDLMSTLRQLGSVSKTADDDAKKLLATLKGYNIDAPKDKYKSEFGDDWKNIKNKYKILKSGTGIPVDAAYQELSGASGFSSYFPDDIWNEYDQLRKIIEVYDELERRSKNRKVNISDEYTDTNLRNQVLDIVSVMQEQSEAEQKVAQASTQTANTISQNENQVRQEYEKTLAQKKQRVEEIDGLFEDYAQKMNNPDVLQSDNALEIVQGYSDQMDILQQERDGLVAEIQRIEAALKNEAQQSQETANTVAQSEEKKQQSYRETADAVEQVSKTKIGNTELDTLNLKNDIDDTDRLAAAINKLKSIQNGIDNIEIGEIDISKGVQEIQTLEQQLESLSKEYNETVAEINGMGGVSATQMQSFQNDIDSTNRKIEQLQSNLREKIQTAIDTTVVRDVQKAHSELDKLSGASDELHQKLQRLDNIQIELEAEKEHGDIQKLSQLYTEYLSVLKDVNTQLDIQKRAQRDSATQQKLDDDIILFQTKIDSWLTKNSAATKQFGSAMLDLKAKAEKCDRTTLNHLESEFKQLDKAAEAAGKKTQTFGQSLKTQFSKYSSYFSIASLFMYAQQGLRSMFEQVKLIDSAMTELKKVTDETDASYNKFLSNAAKRSKELGTTIDGLVSSTADFARLGYGFKDAQGLAEVANIYAVVGDEIEGVEGATESLISTMAAFKDEMNGMSNTDFAMSIIDKFNEIGNNFAISSGGIGEALERSASSLMAANNTIDESIALITAANTVVQDPEAVGKWLADIKSGYIG